MFVLMGGFWCGHLRSAGGFSTVLARIHQVIHILASRPSCLSFPQLWPPSPRLCAVQLQTARRQRCCSRITAPISSLMARSPALHGPARVCSGLHGPFRASVGRSATPNMRRRRHFLCADLECRAMATAASGGGTAAAVGRERRRRRLQGQTGEQSGPGVPS